MWHSLVSHAVIFDCLTRCSPENITIIALSVFEPAKRNATGTNIDIQTLVKERGGSFPLHVQTQMYRASTYLESKQLQRLSILSTKCGTHIRKLFAGVSRTLCCLLFVYFTFKKHDLHGPGLCQALSYYIFLMVCLQKMCRTRPSRQSLSFNHVFSRSRI